jgi:hypothetical protein
MVVLLCFLGSKRLMDGIYRRRRRWRWRWRRQLLNFAIARLHLVSHAA